MTLALTDNQSRAISAIGHALTLHTNSAAWLCLVPILAKRLTPFERACLATVSLEAAENEHVSGIVGATTPDCFAGSPLPTLFDPEWEAGWWADIATDTEREAWLVACFARLSSKSQAGFLEAATRRMAA